MGLEPGPAPRPVLFSGEEGQQGRRARQSPGAWEELSQLVSRVPLSSGVDYRTPSSRPSLSTTAAAAPMNTAECLGCPALRHCCPCVFFFNTRWLPTQFNRRGN